MKNPSIKSIKNSLKKGDQQRTFSVRSYNPETREVELAFSSEEPYLRWYGFEVLGHKAEEIDFSRMNDSVKAPLLLQHNHEDQIGVVTAARLDDDGVCRATVKLSRSDRAEEIAKDLEDGIRTQVSVGYRVLEMQLEESGEEKEDTYRVTKWQPYEVSIVSVAADPTVGIGRDASDLVQDEQEAEKQELSDNDNINNVFTKKDEENMPEKNLTKPAETSSVDAANAAAEKLAERNAKIIAIGEQYGAEKRALEFIKDQSKSVEDFQNVIMSDMQSKSAVTSEAENFEMSEDEIKGYSLFRAIQLAADPHNPDLQRKCAVEHKVSKRALKERAERGIVGNGGLYIPESVLTRASTVTTSTMGSTARPTYANDFVSILNNKSSILSAARVMNGITGGKLVFDVQSNGATAAFVGEDGTKTGDALATTQIELTPKTVRAKAIISRSMMNQSSMDIEAYVEEQLATACALVIDKEALYGDGLNSKPTGLKNITGIGSVTFATANQPSFGEIEDLAGEIDASNGEIDNVKMLFNSNVAKHFRKTASLGNTTGVPMLTNGVLNGEYQTRKSNQVQSDDVFAGDFNQFVVANFAGMEILVTRDADTGGHIVSIFRDMDCAALHPECFALGASAA